MTSVERVIATERVREGLIAQRPSIGALVTPGELYDSDCFTTVYRLEQRWTGSQ